jgi:hypothetical protein
MRGIMSIHDEIGDMSGGQSHLWRGERRTAIVEANKFDPTRSGITLKGDYSELPQEALAAAIASELYEEFTILGSSAGNIVSHIARETLGQALAKQPEKPLVGYFGSSLQIVPTAAAVGWLSYAFDAGATEADLLEWGVDVFVVIQLKWWQRREGETLLNQHVRALRNGWVLPWLGAAARDAYRNLYAFIDGFPQHWKDENAVELAQIDELFAFFGTGLKGNETPNPETLPEAEARAWALAFAAADVELIAPDARGRWGMLPKQGLASGELREPAYTVARYLKKLGHQPADWPVAFGADYFGRVGDNF